MFSSSTFCNLWETTFSSESLVNVSNFWSEILYQHFPLIFLNFGICVWRRGCAAEPQQNEWYWLLCLCCWGRKDIFTSSWNSLEISLDLCLWNEENEEEKMKICVRVGRREESGWDDNEKENPAQPSNHRELEAQQKIRVYCRKMKNDGGK